jgi:hypothetical protein
LVFENKRTKAMETLDVLMMYMKVFSKVVSHLDAKDVDNLALTNHRMRDNVRDHRMYSNDDLVQDACFSPKFRGLGQFRRDASHKSRYAESSNETMVVFETDRRGDDALFGRQRCSVLMLCVDNLRRSIRWDLMRDAMVNVRHLQIVVRRSAVINVDSLIACVPWLETLAIDQPSGKLTITDTGPLKRLWVDACLRTKVRINERLEELTVQSLQHVHLDVTCAMPARLRVLKSTEVGFMLAAKLEALALECDAVHADHLRQVVNIRHLQIGSQWHPRVGECDSFWRRNSNLNRSGRSMILRNVRYMGSCLYVHPETTLLVLDMDTDLDTVVLKTHRLRKIEALSIRCGVRTNWRVDEHPPLLRHLRLVLTDKDFDLACEMPVLGQLRTLTISSTESTFPISRLYMKCTFLDELCIDVPMCANMVCQRCRVLPSALQSLSIHFVVSHGELRYSPVAPALHTLCVTLSSRCSDVVVSLAVDSRHCQRLQKVIVVLMGSVALSSFQSMHNPFPISLHVLSASDYPAWYPQVPLLLQPSFSIIP